MILRKWNLLINKGANVNEPLRLEGHFPRKIGYTSIVKEFLVSTDLDNDIMVIGAMKLPSTLNGTVTSSSALRPTST